MINVLLIKSIILGGNAVMTSANHQSGTERLVEVMSEYDADTYINLQSDEPMVRPGEIELLINKMNQNPSIDIATLCHDVSEEEAEKLEQLRFLYAGYDLRAFKVEPTGPGVDTPESLETVRSIMVQSTESYNTSLQNR